MIEYGLSVSLQNSPRTPRTPRTPTTPPSDTTSMTLAPPQIIQKRRLTFADVSEMDESVSPLVQRQLDFSSFSTELSPISFKTVSTSLSHVHVHSFGGGDAASIGECGVCYRVLPLRANHTYTLCGHLFCLRCFLKWWDTNTTCPLCRAELFEPEEEETNELPEEEEEEEESPSQSLSLSIETNNEREADDSEVYNSVSHTLLEQYLHQDRFFEVIPSTHNSDDEWNTDMDNPLQRFDRTISANVDDMREYFRLQESYALSNFEIRELRKNRDIAMMLYQRMLFRKMLSQTMNFRGEIHYGNAVIPKDEWISSFDLYYHTDNSENNTEIETQLNFIRMNRMHEFVIRRGSELSPMNEMNLFGFIKDIQIVCCCAHGAHGAHGDDQWWENHHEYAFIADVFSARDFYVKGNDGQYNQLCGSYDMSEGVISSIRLNIPFSQIRRLYRIYGE